MGSYGKIVSHGTADKPVLFSAATTNPAAGNWRGIELQGDAGQDSSFSHCIIEYAGNINGYNAGLYLYNCGIFMINSTIRFSAGKGLFLNNAWLILLKIIPSKIAMIFH